MFLLATEIVFSDISMTSAPEEDLCEYEKQRLEHMRRNHEYMVALGLKSADDPIAPNHKKQKTRKKKATIPSLPDSLRRRSPRLAGVTPSPGLVESDDDEEEKGEEPVREMRSTAMEYLKMVREAVLSVEVEDDTSDEWQQEAKRRWGPLVRSTNWKEFVTSRLSTPPPVSPLDFLQEYYAADSWRLLCSCILMSRVSSWQTKHRCISDFFANYPTPSAFANETDQGKLQDILNSLGLFFDRLKSLVALTDAFLKGDSTFQISLDRKSPHKIHGIGEFGRDSYLVFCKDKGATIALSPGGKPIAAFVKWRKSNPSVN